jgi:hypothetical protein
VVVAIVGETVALITKLLDFVGHLLHDLALVVDDSLLDALDDLFALQLEVQVLLQDSLSVTLAIDEEVNGRLYELLIDKSDVAIRLFLQRVILSL